MNAIRLEVVIKKADHTHTERERHGGDGRTKGHGLKKETLWERRAIKN